MVGSPEGLSRLFLPWIDDQFLFGREYEVLYRNEVRMGKIEASRHQLDFLFLPFEVNAIKRHAAVSPMVMIPLPSACVNFEYLLNIGYIVPIIILLFALFPR